MLVPTPNSRVTVAWPSSDVLSIRSSPSRPFMTSSCSLTISRSISAGAAPGHSVVIEITGLLTSGASWIGMVSSAT